jgi:hypothetical protein
MSRANFSQAFAGGASFRRAALLVLVLVALLGFSGPRVHAGLVGAAIDVEVSSSLGTGSFVMDVPVPPEGTSLAKLEWEIPGAYDLYSSSHVWLGQIKDLEVKLNGDPNAFVFFSFQAGPVPTTFNVNSSLVSFGAIPGAIGSASAGVTVTDTSGNGASLVGNFPGTTSFQAEYNNGVVFADLVNPALAPGATSTQSGSLLNVPIGPAVFNIQSKFSFVLSPNDIGSGTGNFTITPEPSSLCLAVVGAAGLAFLARRRRKA